MYHYYCSKCHKIYGYNIPPFELKCALNPHLAIKVAWDEKDWKVPVSLCNCGGEIKPGHPKQFTNIGYGEHERWSWAMGVNVQDIPEITKRYPDRKYHPKTGQLLVKNRPHKKKLMREHGMEEFN